MLQFVTVKMYIYNAKFRNCILYQILNNSCGNKLDPEIVFLTFGDISHRSHCHSVCGLPLGQAANRKQDHLKETSLQESYLS